MFNKGDSINQPGNKNIAIQNSEINLTISAHDKLAELGAAGDYEGVFKLMKQLQDHASIQHPYHPDYKFKTTEIGSRVFVEHEPTSKEVAEKLPLTYRGQFKVVGEDVTTFQDLGELIHESFMNQKDIKIDVLSLKALIGEKDVPTPFLEENTKEGDWYIKAEKLPEPLKVKILLRNEEEEITLMDYVELNMGHGDRKSKVVSIDNRRQEHSKLLIKLTFRLNQLENSEGTNVIAQNVNIDFSIKEKFTNDIDAILQFLRISKLSIEKPNHTLSFKNLVTDSMFMSSRSLKAKVNKDIDIEKEISFIQMLSEIENYFNIKFTIPKIIESEDYISATILESIMLNQPIKKTFQEETYNIDSKSTLQTFIENFHSDNPLIIDMSGPGVTVELFGASVAIKRIECRYHSVKPENLDKLTKKLEAMDDGEIIKVKLLPKHSNAMEEQYYI